MLLVRQNTKCELKGGVTKVLPFKDLYPGEPEILNTWVEVEILASESEKPDRSCRVSPRQAIQRSEVQFLSLALPISL